MQRQAGKWDGALNEPKITAKLFTDDGTFPNNERLPLLIYVEAFALPTDDPATFIERTFEANGWGGMWRNGIYTYHHYHSNAHEALGCYAGTARVQLGGADGVVIDFNAGDAILIPAGVAHKCLETSGSFRIIGAYPRGQHKYDVRRGIPEERPHTDKSILRVPLPQNDPVYGAAGPMHKEWRVPAPGLPAIREAESDDLRQAR
ncbi:MAG: hypothetical protein JO317_06585 [Verrucomicrobiae bacterium]|nr:hypothetical protein [Verrucomicrobiae bacterium]